MYTKKSNFILNHGAFIQWFKLISQKEKKKKEEINNISTEKNKIKEGEGESPGNMSRNPSKHFQYSAIRDIEMRSLPWILTHPLFGFKKQSSWRLNNKSEERKSAEATLS